jgi:hypothetical protein
MATKRLKEAPPHAGYRAKRRAAYPPVAEQLDVLWKQFDYMRLTGTDLIQDADDLLGKILAVKRKYPKPKPRQ